MPFAIVLYLPIYLNATIMIGGVVRMFMDGRKNVDEKTKNDQVTDGTLYCAGMIAGEGIIGILLAVFAVVKIDSKIILPFHLPQVGSLVLYIALLVLLYVVCMKADKEK